MGNVRFRVTKMDENRHKNGVVAAQDGTEIGTTSAQKRGRKGESQRSEELAITLPPGIQIGTWRDGRSKPFYVRYGKERHVQSYASERERNDYAEKLADVREREGSSVLEFVPDEWREWRAFRQRCPAPLHELEALWLGTRRDTMLVKDAIPRYLALRLSEDVTEGSDTHRHMDLHLKRLNEAFGALRLDQVTPDLIRDLMGKLLARDRKSEASNDTKRDHRKNWNTFFQRAVDEDWCVKNPCEKVKPPQVFEQDKTPLTPREIFELLKHNANQPVIGRITLELYGFLRNASAQRLKKEELRFDARGIRLPGAVRDEETGQMVVNHKSRKTKYRQGHAPVLWAWLEHAPEGCWTEIGEHNYDFRKSEAFIRARVKNVGNVLRDSCISYHLAAFKNPPLTSYLAQHARMSQTETYEGVVEESDAKLVMAMTPNAVKLTWVQFERKYR